MFDGCEPGANAWVEKYFHDCVIDYRDAVGFTLGLCSIFVWLTAQLPQFVSNIKNQSSEALSIWFLVEWFAGDTLNLLGCLIQGQQLPTTTILAAYFVLMDVIMLLQYIYYGALQARRKRLRAKASRRRHGHHRHAGLAQQQYHRDESHQQARRILQEDLLSMDANQPLSTCPDGGGSQQPSEQERSSACPRNSRLQPDLRVLTAATATGVSLVCVAALALHPAGLPGNVGRRLLSLPEGHGHLDDVGAGSLRFSPGDTSGSGSSLGAMAAGAALLGVGRSFGALAQPATAFLSSEGGSGAGDGGGGGGSGGNTETGAVGCSFLNCDVALVAGTAMGYLSTCFYLASRVSQIRKNLSRRSTEGLSPAMFLLTMSANMCTGVSIVLRLRSLEQLKEQLPWMCGTFGTIALDCTLFYQALTLGQHAAAAGAPDGGHSSHHHHHHHHHQGQGDSGCVLAGGEAYRGCGGKLSDLEAPLLGPLAPDNRSGGDADAVAAVAV